MSWHAGPINSPRRLHAVGALSPRRPDQLKDAFLQSFQYSAGSGFDAHDFWDSFVASQNSKQVEQLTYFRSRPPSSASSRLSPRSTRTTPRTKPGKKLWESFGLPPPPQPQPRPPVFPKAPRETLGRPNILANRARLAAAAKKAGMSQFQMENLVTRTEDEMHSRYKDLHAAFKAVDVDDSGNVSKDELMRAMQRWNMGNANGSNIPLLQEAAAMLDALDQNGDGQISYEEFVEGLARGATGDTSAIPKPKARRVTDPLADPRSYLKPGVTPEDLVAAHTSVRDKLLSKHGTIHKAFKFMDKDGSGFINRAEFEGALRQLNLNLPKAVLDSLMDIIDVEDDDDGDEDHDIAFREFARVMQAADVFKMGVLEPRPDQSKRDLARQTARQEALEHLRPGVTCDELRKYQELVKSKIQAKHKTSAFTSAFKWIDADRTGSITREEFKEALASLNLNMVRPAVLETLCDFIDSDGSGSFGYAEFSRVLAADDVMQMAPGKLKKAGLI